MATKHIQAKVEIIRTKWKSCSYNGDPSYWCTFRNKETDQVLMGYTATDASCGYGIRNSNINWLEYHYTATGNIVITRCDHVE